MDEEKYNKDLKIWAWLLGIIQGLVSILTFFTTMNKITKISSVVILFIIYLFISLSKKGNKIGPIIGLILGVLYILSGDIVSIIIGILLVVDCIKFLKYLS